LFAQAVEENVDVEGIALGDKFDVAVVEVADGTGEGEISGEMDGGHTKSYTVDPAGEEDDATFGHGSERCGNRRLYAGVTGN
jgi:hypothetical protein